MRAELHFNLPEEAVDHRMAINGPRWHSVVWELDQWLRQSTKYGEKKTWPDAEAVRSKIVELMADENVEFEP